MPKNTNKKSTLREVVEFPRHLLDPIGRFLQNQLKVLERRKEEVDKDDPFSDRETVADQADDAAEQFSHVRSSAIKESLDRKIIQTRKAMSRVYLGKYGICEDCGKMIDTDRLIIYPEATLCAACQKKREN